MEANLEKEIGARLRAFREVIQIPRTKFAAAIGFGSERIASYEAGRAPLPYQVFKAVSDRYNISPLWLATQRGSPKFYGPFDDSQWSESIKPHAIFSEVFDSLLKEYLEAEEQEASRTIENAIALMQGTMKRQVRSFSERELQQWQRTLKELGLAIHSRKRLERSANTKLAKWNLTDTETSSSVAEVKAQLPGLLERLRKATAETGKKSELADFLKRVTKANVPLASVSRWLSGEREPGGEVTLQLLRWVELQERQGK